MADTTNDRYDTVEHRRLRAADEGWEPWRAWGPYVSERAWGTVREDYSEDGDAWGFFPHDHARSRVYRWSEDGIAGICDEAQTFCLALALWNGVDPMLKERMFGLTGRRATTARTSRSAGGTWTRRPRTRGCAGATTIRRGGSPTHDLVGHGRRAGRAASTSCSTPGSFADDRYWAVTVDYAKADPTDLCMRITRGEPRTRIRRPCTCCRRCGSATPGRGACRARTRCPASRPTVTGPCARSTRSSAASS